MKDYFLAWKEEPILMWRLWKSKWFPYRTATLYGFHKDEMVLGPWKWHPPGILKKIRDKVVW